MNPISDPGRPSRRDRRRAQKFIDTAFAEGRLTAADRTLRSQRIDAAHSKGDLATITRDLTAPTTAHLGRALNPTTLSGMTVGGTRKSPVLGGIVAAPAGATLDLSKGVGRRVKWIVVSVALVIIGSCLLGFVGLVASAFQAADVTSSSRPAPAESATTGAAPSSPSVGLHTADGWDSLVDAIEGESGSTSVYDAVVYPDYASLGLDGDGAVERRLYRNGGWQEGFSARTPVHGSLVDLAAIDSDVWAGLIGRTADHFDVANPSGAYVIVNAFAGTPTIMVYIQSEAGSQYRSYGLDGTPVG